MRPFIYVVCTALFFFRPESVRADKQVITNNEFGYEIWRMTSAGGTDWSVYYTNNLYSPNGKYLIFKTGRSPGHYIINSDGTNEKPLFSGGSAVDGGPGNWSHDSKYFYLSGPQAVNVAAGTISTIGNVMPFHWPVISPDGKTLFGMSNSADAGSGQLKFINVDGTNPRTFNPPYTGGNQIDISHSWLGNNQGVYWNNYTGSWKNEVVVFDVNTGAFAGFLTLKTSDWTGIFNHTTLSAAAYFVGEGAGLVAGHGSGFRRANTKYWLYQASDLTAREVTKISDATDQPTNNHSNISPDGKWFLAEASSVYGTCTLTVYPIDKSSNSLPVVRYNSTSTCSHTSYLESPNQTWSPDSTKIVYFTDYDLTSGTTTGNYDIYAAVFKKPSPPANLSAKLINGTTLDLTWKPPSQHREIKEYQIYRSSSQNGTYQQVATVPIVNTYLNAGASSKLTSTATTVTVDSTAGFPASGAVEILGLSPEYPTEVVSYTGISGNSFTGCTRGAMGTSPAEHYHQAFVWKYNGVHGFQEASVAGSWYKIKSGEWSGLTSDFSQPVSSVGGYISPTPGFGKPGDANEDGIVNGADFSIWLQNYGRVTPTPVTNGHRSGDFNGDGIVNGADFSIWLNNYGR